MYRRIGGQTRDYLNYNVTVTPSSATVPKGTSTNAEVTVSTNLGFDEQVILNSTGVPDDVTISFNPNDGTPTFGSTMQITVLDNAPTITQTITINAATTEGDKKTATFELTITE